MRRFGPTGPTIRVGGDAVGEHAHGTRGDATGPLVRAACQQACHGLERAEGANVGASIEILRHLHRQERAVALGGHLDVEDLTATVGGRLQALGAGFDPADWPFEEPGRRRDEVVLGIGTDLAAEPAADVVRDDAHLRLGQTHGPRHEQSDEVRVLGGHPDRELVLEAVVLGRYAARLDRRGRQTLLEDTFLDDHLRLVEGCLHRVLGRERRVPGEIVHVGSVHAWTAWLEGRQEIGDRGQWFVLDLDRLRAVHGQLAVLCYDHRDGLALEDGFVAGDRKPLGDGVFFGDEGRCDRMGTAEQRLEVGRGEDRDHAGYRVCASCVDPPDARVRMRTAHDRHRQQPRPRQVLDVPSAAGDQVGILAAMDACANHLADSHTSMPSPR